MQGSQYALNEEPDRAKKAICTARVLTFIGIISGIAVVVIFIFVRILVSNTTSNRH